MSGRRPGSPEEIAKLMARFGNAAVTYARRLDVARLLPVGYEANQAGRTAAMKVAEETLDEFLSEDGVYWRGAELDYWILLPNCAQAGWELKWNAITGGLFHRLREKLGGAALPGANQPHHTPYLGLAQFQQMVERHRQTSGTPPVKPIDLREVLFGSEGADIRISQRVWSMVEALLDGYFHAGGHYTRLADDRIGLFMPKLGASLAALKRDVIIREIRERFNRAGKPAREAPPRPQAAQPPAIQTAPEPSCEEKKLWTQAFRDMLAGLPIDAAAVIGDGAVPHFGYDPVCRVRQRLITGNLLRLELEEETEDTRADFLAIADAVQQLRQEQSGAADGVLIVPVRFPTLDHLAARTLYLTLCSQIPERRRNRLVFELTDIPCDLRCLRLDERVRQLRPFCRNVVIRTEISRTDFSQFDCLSSRLVGVDLSLYRAAGPAMAEALLRFGHHAQGAGFRPYAHGVQAPEMASAAIGKGFEFLSGEAIAAKVQQPVGIGAWASAITGNPEMSL